MVESLRALSSLSGLASSSARLGTLARYSINLLNHHVVQPAVVVGGSLLRPTAPASSQRPLMTTALSTYTPINAASPHQPFPKSRANKNNNNNNNNSNSEAYDHVLSLVEAFRRSAGSIVQPKAVPAVPVAAPVNTTAATAADNLLSIRRAVAADAASIHALLSGPMSRGSILPISVETIARTISNYVVCHINGELAGSACLKHFPGKIAELTKICTSPAFQGRGIASHLVRQLFDHAEFEGKNYVFALTTEPAMARVFVKLGFVNVDRERLCDEWREGYDMARPSKAYYRPVHADPLGVNNPLPLDELSYFGSVLPSLMSYQPVAPASTSTPSSSAASLLFNHEPVAAWSF